MEQKMLRWLRSALIFTTGFDAYFPRTNSGTILWNESLFDFSFGERNKKKRRELLWALILSYEPEDVQCALIILKGSLLIANNPWKKKKLMYMIALVLYRSGDYLKSLELVDRCLEITPHCRKTTRLKNILKELIEDDKVRGILSVASMIVGVGIGVVGPTTLVSSTWVIEILQALKDRVKRVVNATLANTRNPLQLKEEIYLFARQYYKRGKYSRARLVIDCCLEIAPEWEPALILKKSIESEWCPEVHP